MRAVCRTLLLVSLLTGFSGAVAAAEAVARATFVSGSVQARGSDGTTRTLNRGGELHAGDTIITGSGASAQLTFADNSRLAVRASTEFAIDEFRMGQDEGFVLRLARGALRSITGLIGQRHKGNFSLRTPVATIGIRGTDFEAVHVPEGGGSAFGGAVDPGTYNKVYSGGTQLVSKAGKIDLNINEVGFIGIGGGTGAGPVKIDQLPPGITKLINAAPIVSKAETRPTGEGSSTARTDEKTAPAGTDASSSTEVGTTSLKLDSSTLTTTKLPTTTLDSTTLKTLDTTTLDSSSIKTLDSSTLSTTTLDTSAIKSTTTLSPTTTTLPTTTTTTTTLPTTTLDTSKLNTTTINSTTLQSTTTLKLDTSTQLTK